MAQLQALAGGAGAAGAAASFIVDGFSNGRIPPRDQIQQIIIDTNVFSAEGTGGPRIQIITRPGTGTWSGNLNLNFNHSSITEVRFSGTDWIYVKNYSASETNYLGVFTFSSLDGYLAGRPITFRQTTGDPVVNVSQLEFASFIQADWRVNPKLNIGTGVRYQAQTNLSDYNNLAPSNVNFRMPLATTLSFLLTANAGRPYSITTGQDNNGDQVANDCPVGVLRNSLTGPSTYNVSMNFTKQFALRKAETTQSAGNNAAGAAATPQMIIAGPGGPAVIAAPPASTSPGPKANFSVNVNNLLNNTQNRGYFGVLTSPLFGRSTGAAAGRSINLGLNFTF
jgi:hypothetical protein